MQIRRFKIRQDLKITVNTEKGSPSYAVVNPISGAASHFSPKAYTILRHFNGRRDLAELKRHLQERHELYLSCEALESYIDLFLEAYLFDRTALGIYWERLDQVKKGIVAEELKEFFRQWQRKLPEGVAFVEAMVLNAAIQSLKEKDVLKAIDYLSDCLSINPQNSFAEELLQIIENKIIAIGIKPKVFIIAEELKDKARELSYAPALAIVLLAGIILSQLLFLNSRPRIVKFQEKELNIIKVVSDTLLQAKLDTL
jgi:tetratricopeptide (TPR) repeat protein